MNTLTKIFNILSAIIFILFQQGIIIVIGFIVYAQSNLFWGIAIWLLTLPMIYVNIQTWKGVRKYGVLLFITANSDTSSIDIKPKNNPYKEGI
jgi:hypothetical protein